MFLKVNTENQIMYSCLDTKTKFSQSLETEIKDLEIHSWLKNFLVKKPVDLKKLHNFSDSRIDITHEWVEKFGQNNFPLDVLIYYNETRSVVEILYGFDYYGNYSEISVDVPNFK